MRKYDGSCHEAECFLASHVEFAVDVLIERRELRVGLDLHGREAIIQCWHDLLSRAVRRMEERGEAEQRGSERRQAHAANQPESVFDCGFHLNPCNQTPSATLRRRCRVARAARSAPSRNTGPAIARKYITDDGLELCCNPNRCPTS